METKPEKVDELLYPIIDVDPFSGTIQKMVKVDGKNYIQTICADLQANTDWNQTLQNDGSNGYGKSRELKHVASVPLHMIELWKKIYGVDVFNEDHAEAFKRLLEAPEFRHFRTDNCKPI
jgi:hypothetical protein